MRTLNRILVCCLFLLLSAAVWGQDIITTTAGARIGATVVETQGNSIKYRFKDSKKTYSMPKSKVAQVKFADGRIEQFSQQITPSAGNKSMAQTPKQKPAAEKHRKFLVGLGAGIGVSTGRYDYKTTVAPPATSFRLAPAAGIYFDWRMARHFALQMNVLYKEKGDRINMEKWVRDIDANTYFDFEEPAITSTASGYRTTRISYVEASLLPVIVLGKRLEIGLGGYLGTGLSGKQKEDYTLSYNSPFLESETYQSEKPVAFVGLLPESIDDNHLYVNKFDYGLMSHVGVRMNPVKVSLNLAFGTRQWEPDSELAGIFFNNIDHTYNMNWTLSAVWFFGAK